MDCDAPFLSSLIKWRNQDLLVGSFCDGTNEPEKFISRPDTSTHLWSPPSHTWHFTPHTWTFAPPHSSGHYLLPSHLNIWSSSLTPEQFLLHSHLCIFSSSHTWAFPSPLTPEIFVLLIHLSTSSSPHTWEIVLPHTPEHFLLPSHLRYYCSSYAWALSPLLTPEHLFLHPSHLSKCSHSHTPENLLYPQQGRKELMASWSLPKDPSPVEMFTAPSE